MIRFLKMFQRESRTRLKVGLDERNRESKTSLVLYHKPPVFRSIRLAVTFLPQFKTGGALIRHMLPKMGCQGKYPVSSMSITVFFNLFWFMAPYLTKKLSATLDRIKITICSTLISKTSTKYSKFNIWWEPITPLDGVQSSRSRKSINRTYCIVQDRPPDKR